VNCTRCSTGQATVCRISCKRRADYFCVDCMNTELDAHGFVEGDTWVTVPVESTMAPRE